MDSHGTLAQAPPGRGTCDFEPWSLGVSQMRLGFATNGLAKNGRRWEKQWRFICQSDWMIVTIDNGMTMTMTSVCLVKIIFKKHQQALWDGQAFRKHSTPQYRTALTDSKHDKTWPLRNSQNLVLYLAARTCKFCIWRSTGPTPQTTPTSKLVEIR